MKCSNHPDKEASAICERCNLFYCGNCVLSSNGKCPKCRNTLCSPQSVMSYEIHQDEIYKGRGQPHLIEAVNSLYMEPERAMRRIKEYSSLLTSTIHLTLLYIIMFVIWVLLLIVVSMVPDTFGIVQPNLMNARNIFTFVLVNILYFGVFIVVWLFASLLYFLPAKLLGGKGEYIQQASLLAYIMFAIFPLGTFSVLLAAIPQLGPSIAFLASAIVVVYLLYLIFLSIREINQFKTTKALMSLAISIAIFVFIGLLITLISMLIFSLPIIGNLPQPSV
ncbi:YIP1 family protein [Candidatus Micrarchaeota archaeon]|nr:YIP1 family protein [Candidatus Micrarchaeota archaeon]